MVKTEKGVSFFVEDVKGRKIVISPELIRDILKGKGSKLSLMKFIVDAQSKGKTFSFRTSPTASQQYQDIVDMIKLIGGRVQQDSFMASLA